MGQLWDDLWVISAARSRLQLFDGRRRGRDEGSRRQKYSTGASWTPSVIAMDYHNLN
jgi:hypothetical protein